jgi:hypothetical protein
VLEEALLMAWACGGPRATTAVADARRGDVAPAIARQASAWPADLIVLARRPRPALTRLVGGSVPDQVMRKAACPVLAVPPGKAAIGTTIPGRPELGTAGAAAARIGFAHRRRQECPARRSPVSPLWTVRSGDEPAHPPESRQPHWPAKTVQALRDPGQPS